MATLDVSNPAPRVNAAQLGQFVGKRVTLVGRVESVEGNTLRLKAADDGVVTVQLQNIAPQAAVLEVQGVVNSPNTVTEDTCSPYSDNFDLANYNELCKLRGSQQYHALFLP